jgi:hypothetical protein
VADTLILPLANTLLTCLEAELALNPDPPAEYCLRVGTETIHDVDGTTALDKVCCPGLGFVRLGPVYPTTEFPEPDTRSDRCLSLARALELTLGVVRCVPGMGTEAGPTCEDWTTAALHDANDIDALFKSVCCWRDTTEFGRMRGRRFTVTGSTVLQQADCVERVLTVLVELPRCC